jgi:hypothetical protein
VLVAAAVCPHPPLLIPEAMGAAGLAARRPRPAAESLARPEAGRPWQAAESLARPEAGRPWQAAESLARPEAGSPEDAAGSDDSRIPELLAACGTAVAGLAAAHPDLIAVVGGAAQTARYDASAAGSLRSFGIPFTTGSGEPVLPLSLTVGSWLLQQYLPAEADRDPRRFHERVVDSARYPGKINHAHVLLQAVRQSMPTASCLRMGAEIAARAPRVALLVMGDGSARKVIGVHGAADPAAERYDAEVAAALADADPGRLARLDPALDGELMVAGRAAWQVLAGAAGGCRLHGQLHFAAAPLDVGYLVASWAAD